MALKAVVEYHFHWLYAEFCLIPIFFDMHMHRLMVVGIEHEPEVEYLEYGRHVRQFAGKAISRSMTW